MNFELLDKLNEAMEQACMMEDNQVKLLTALKSAVSMIGCVEACACGFDESSPIQKRLFSCLERLNAVIAEVESAKP